MGTYPYAARLSSDPDISTTARINTRSVGNEAGGIVRVSEIDQASVKASEITRSIVQAVNQFACAGQIVILWSD